MSNPTQWLYQDKTIKWSLLINLVSCFHMATFSSLASKLQRCMAINHVDSLTSISLFFLVHQTIMASMKGCAYILTCRKPIIIPVISAKIYEAFLTQSGVTQLLLTLAKHLYDFSQLLLEIRGLPTENRRKTFHNSESPVQLHETYFRAFSWQNS